MSDDPTEDEVRRVLEQMESVMLSNKLSIGPTGFQIVWRDNLHAFSFLMDGRGTNVHVLIDTGHDYVWQRV